MRPKDHCDTQTLIQYLPTWFIVVLNTGLRPHLVVSEIIAIAEPGSEWVSVKTEEDSRQLMMKRCMLRHRGTNVNAF